MNSPYYEVTGGDHLSVDITVRFSGNTYNARAGKGKLSKAASCTSDALSAAYRVASKWLCIPKHQIVVEQISHSGFRARPLSAGETITEIIFEDKGQDFLRWILSSDGVVIACTPFQAWAWCGGRVKNAETLQVGGLVEFESGQYSSTIKYRIIMLRKGDASLALGASGEASREAEIATKGGR